MQVTVLPTLRLSLLDLRDQGSLAIVDVSSYSSIPSSSHVALQVTPPGWPTINVPFNPGAVNVFKCADFGITCALVNCCPLPDGIYSVTYTVNVPGNPVATITKTFMKVDQLDCRFSNLFLKIDLQYDCPGEEKKKLKQQVREVDLLKNGAIAAANDCDDLLAYKLYQLADSYIDKIYKYFCKSCSPLPACDKCD